MTPGENGRRANTRFAPTSADHPSTPECVLSASSPQDVIPEPAVEQVVTSRAGEPVVAGLAEEARVPRDARRRVHVDAVVAPAAEDRHRLAVAVRDKGDHVVDEDL